MKAALSEKIIFHISIMGLLLSLFFVAFSIYNLSKNTLPTLYTFIFGYSLFFAFGILYYLFDNKIKKREEKSNNNNFNNFYSYRVSRILQIFFFIIVILILIILNKSLYIKPLSYYLLTSLATAIVGFQIISKQETDKKQDYAILFLQIIPLAIIIRGSSFLINPYLIGPDVPWHFHFIQNIIENGHLDPSAVHYYYHPSYHLTQSISGVILGFSKTTFNLINLTTSVVSIIIAYLVGKEIFNRKAGLMCSMLLTIATVHIFLVTYNTSKIGGTTLFLLCLLLLIKMYKFRDIKATMLFWISAVPLFFWHPEISFALMILLGTNLLVYAFIKGKLELNAAFTLYLVAYIGYFVYAHTSLFTTFIQGIFIEKPPGLIQSFAAQTVSIGFLHQSSMAYLGITLSVFFVSYIGLKWLNKLNEVTLFLLSSLTLLHILPFIGIISGHYGLNPERSLTYVSILLILITGGAVFEVFKSKNAMILFVIILFVFSFFSVSSYLIGDGNKVFNDEVPIGLVYTTRSNIATHNFLNRIPSEGTISGDRATLGRGIFNPLPNQRVICFPNFDEDGYIVVNPYNLERMKLKMSWEINDKFYNKLYDNYKITVYKQIKAR
jgi:hypothetical protein